MTQTLAVSVPTGMIHFLRPDLVRLRLPLVNVYFLGQPGEPWVLVDAGVPGTAGLIQRAAAQLYGALRPLLRHWPAPVYAHSLELPSLRGQAASPFPDPTAGGSMSLLSPAFVPSPFDFRPAVQALPEEERCPACPAGSGCTRRGTRPGTCPCGAPPTAASWPETLWSPPGRNPR